jgi:hypothetical protein
MLRVRSDDTRDHFGDALAHWNVQEFVWTVRV